MRCCGHGDEPSCSI